MAGGASDRCVPVGVMLLGEGTATPGEKSGGARMSSKAAKGPPDATEPSRVARCACRDREINPTTESIQTVVEQLSQYRQWFGGRGRRRWTFPPSSRVTFDGAHVLVYKTGIRAISNLQGC